MPEDVHGAEFDDRCLIKLDVHGRTWFGTYSRKRVRGSGDTDPTRGWVCVRLRRYRVCGFRGGVEPPVLGWRDLLWIKGQSSYRCNFLGMAR